MGDNITYKKLLSDPTESYRTQLDLLMEWGYGINALNSKERLYLVPSACRIPIIYTLPKIHKNIQVPPACPIVNAIGSVTAWLGEYLDKFLQPSVKVTRAYLKDTSELLQLLDDVQLSTASETYLVTAYVCSLYTIIQHEDAALALNWALSRRDDIPHSQKQFLGYALDYFRSHNYFWWNGQFFSQQVGVAMVAKYAPSLPNLFMAEWEDRHVFSKRCPQLKFYRRFIDDLLFIWEGSQESAVEFLEDLNRNTNNIKLDCQISESSNFLDVIIEKDKLNTKAAFLNLSNTEEPLK